MEVQRGSNWIFEPFKPGSRGSGLGFSCPLDQTWYLMFMFSQKVPKPGPNQTTASLECTVQGHSHLPFHRLLVSCPFLFKAPFIYWKVRGEQALFWRHTITRHWLQSHCGSQNRIVPIPKLSHQWFHCHWHIWHSHTSSIILLMSWTSSCPFPAPVHRMVSCHPWMTL